MEELQEMWVWSLSQEDPLEEAMAAYSRFLAWRIPWIKEPGGLQSMGSQRVRHNWLSTHATEVGGHSSASPSRRWQMDLRLLILPGTTSLDAQILSFDDDFELKSANYDLWAELAPGLFLYVLQTVIKRNICQGKICTSVSLVAEPRISVVGEPSGVYKERHNSQGATSDFSEI